MFKLYAPRRENIQSEAYSEQLRTFICFENAAATGTLPDTRKRTPMQARNQPYLFIRVSNVCMGAFR